MFDRFFSGKLSRLAVSGILSGAALAVAAFPAVGLGGLIVNRVTYIYNHPPDDLHIPQNAQITRVYANDGKTLITNFYDERRSDVSLSAISPWMQKAIVASEDTRFYQHGGVDLRSVIRAFVSNGQGGNAQQGASTLTMQYVRNVLKEDPNLSPQRRVDATANNAGRKITEMRYAISLDKKFSKQEILRRYLNIAYFGNGAYGIDAASRSYFSKAPGQLTLPEAALLAGIVQSPDVDNPAFGDRNAALARRTYVLGAMAKMKVITPAQAAAADKAPVDIKVSVLPNNCTAVPKQHNDWGYFCDYLTQWWANQPEFGQTVQDREDALKEGGYTIVTSMDPKTQASALSNSLSVYGYGSPMALPLAVVQPGTGRIAAMAVNRHYSLDPNPGGVSYPNSTAQFIGGDGGIQGYPSGSTFKMFTMLAALESGKTLSTEFNSPAKLQTKWYANGSSSCNGYWCPGNDNPSWMDGPRTMWNGFGRSVNTYFVWLEEQIGPEQAVAMAQRLGITFRAPADAELAGVKAINWGSFTLGVADTTPLDLANAYAAVGADGRYCDPLPVLSIKDAGGASMAAANPNCRPAVAPDIARAALDAARCPVGEQSAFGRCDGGTAPEVGSIMGGRPIAGKTGSTENNATETFVGVTPQLAAAAIAADPDNPSDLAGEGVSSSVNSAVAHTLNTALTGQPVVNFQPPSAAIAGAAG
ncbi:transglycosylase domain-containing protein [Rugosimonospora acidiphila]|uniref:Transglycosylase domain-containing protein n=1 Tax=Rugosimonospora acidiphila TaxID=556531 RepID=A0ABP9SJZ1_9ACTN